MSQSSKSAGTGRSLSIKAKFAGLVVGATFVSCLSVGLLSYQIGKDGLIEASKLRLESVAGNQSKGLASYEERISQSLADLAQNTAIGQAVETMTNIIPSEAESIRAEYLRAEKTPEERASFDGTGLRLLYAVHHSSIHGTIASAWKNSRVSDIYVTDMNGTVVYSVTKGSEMLQNASAVPALGDFATRIQAGSVDDVQTTPFSPYQLDGGKPSALIGKQLAVASWGKVVTKGAIIFRISSDELTRAVTPAELGTSIDEALLLDGNGAYRSGAFVNGEAHQVPTELAQAATNQTAGSAFATVADKPLFFAYQPVTLFGEKH
ncbi:MAG: methyl-accepting chemotaxis protein, partial [Pseudorhizobium sp.]